jgi:hypothetical protein
MKAIFGILAFATLLALAVGCEQAAKITRTPLPEVVGQTARDGSPGFNYTVWVDCTIRNNGASGNIEVQASLTGGGSWTKRETVYVEEDGEKMVTLAFPEVTLLGGGLGGFEYVCGSD